MKTKSKKQDRFKTVSVKDGKTHFDLHIIDQAGNHFINGKCVNPKVNDINPETGERLKVGETYPPISERIYPS